MESLPDHHCCCRYSQPYVQTAEIIPKKKKKSKSASTRRRDTQRKIQFLQRKHGYSSIQTSATDNSAPELAATTSQLKDNQNDKGEELTALKALQEKLKEQLDLADRQAAALQELGKELDDAKETIKDLETKNEDLQRTAESRKRMFESCCDELREHRATIKCKDTTITSINKTAEAQKEQLQKCLVQFKAEQEKLKQMNQRLNQFCNNDYGHRDYGQYSNHGYQPQRQFYR